MNPKHLIAFSALFAATQAEALPVASVSLDTVTVSPSAPYTDTNGLLTDYGNAAASPWMKKLRSVAQGSGETFRILQIGDSHTAGDFFTDSLRKRLQKTWGDGGIGWVYPANVKGQRMAAVRYNGNWQSLNSRSAAADFPLGGILAHTGSGGSMTLTASDGKTGKQRISL
ncbi:TPA: GDSL family lipase, partial [Neisseria meningitidis]